MRPDRLASTRSYGRDLDMMARAVLLFMLVARFVVAGPVSSDQREPEARNWPTTGSARALPVRRSGPTNAQRIARGLAPLTPARLYDASRVHSAPVARLSANPAPATGADGYELYACYSATADPSTAYQLTADNDQDAVDACAESSGRGGIFTILYQGDGQYLCAPGDYGQGDDEACTTTNYAEYDGYG